MNIFTKEYVAEVLRKKCSSELVGGDGKSIDDIFKSIKEHSVDDLLEDLRLYHFDDDDFDEMNNSRWSKTSLLENVILPSLESRNDRHWFSVFLADGTFNPADEYWLHGAESHTVPQSSNDVYMLLAGLICDFYEGFDGTIFDILQN